MSFCLYGPYPSEYYSGLEKLLVRVKEVYPGWVVRVYLDLSNAEEQVWACSLACKYGHLDFCNIKDIPGQ